MMPQPKAKNKGERNFLRSPCSHHVMSLFFHHLPHGDDLLIRHSLDEIDAVGVPGQIDLRGL